MRDRKRPMDTPDSPPAEMKEAAGQGSAREDLCLHSEGEYVEWAPPPEAPTSSKPPVLTEEEFSAWREGELQRMPEEERKREEQALHDLLHGYDDDGLYYYSQVEFELSLVPWRLHFDEDAHVLGWAVEPDYPEEEAQHWAETLESIRGKILKKLEEGAKMAHGGHVGEAIFRAFPDDELLRKNGITSLGYSEDGVPPKENPADRPRDCG